MLKARLDARKSIPSSANLVAPEESKYQAEAPEMQAFVGTTNVHATHQSSSQ